jgi:hypothetical protein
VSEFRANSSFPAIKVLVEHLHCHFHSLLFSQCSNTKTKKIMAPAGKTTIPQKILNVTASLARRRNVKVSRQKVATLCGYPKQERSFTNALGMLQNKKFQNIYGKEDIEVTEAGYDLADPSAPVETNKDALEQAKTKIKSSKARQIFFVFSNFAPMLAPRLPKRSVPMRPRRASVTSSGP